MNPLSPGGCNGRLSTVIHANHVENMDDMALDFVRAETESGGDSGIGIAFGHEPQDLGFPEGQVIVF